MQHEQLQAQHSVNAAHLLAAEARRSACVRSEPSGWSGRGFRVQGAQLATGTLTCSPPSKESSSLAIGYEIGLVSSMRKRTG